MDGIDPRKHRPYEAWIACAYAAQEKKSFNKEE